MWRYFSKSFMCNDGPRGPRIHKGLLHQMQNPERLRKEFATAGLSDIKVETIIETTEFQTGKELWDWLVWGNPIVEVVLGSLNLTDAERSVIQQVLEQMVRERAGRRGAAELTNPINIGVGTK